MTSKHTTARCIFLGLALAAMTVTATSCVVGDDATGDDLLDQDWPEEAGTPSNPNDEELALLDGDPALQYSLPGCTTKSAGWVTVYGPPYYYLAVLIGGKTQCEARCYQIRNSIRTRMGSNLWNAYMNYYPLKHDPDQTNCYIVKR